MKRGTDIPYLLVEVVRITCEEEIAYSPRVYANPYTLLPLLEISHVSTNKNEHKRFVNQYVRLGSSPNQWQK